MLDPSFFCYFRCGCMCLCVGLCEYRMEYPLNPQSFSISSTTLRRMGPALASSTARTSFAKPVGVLRAWFPPIMNNGAPCKWMTLWVVVLIVLILSTLKIAITTRCPSIMPFGINDVNRSHIGRTLHQEGPDSVLTRHASDLVAGDAMGELVELLNDGMEE